MTQNLGRASGLRRVPGWYKPGYPHGDRERGVSRRSFLKNTGILGIGLSADPTLWRKPAFAGTIPPEQVQYRTAPSLDGTPVADDTFTLTRPRRDRRSSRDHRHGGELVIDPRPKGVEQWA